MLLNGVCQVEVLFSQCLLTFQSEAAEARDVNTDCSQWCVTAGFGARSQTHSLWGVIPDIVKPPTLTDKHSHHSAVILSFPHNIRYMSQQPMNANDNTVPTSNTPCCVITPISTNSILIFKPEWRNKARQEEINWTWMLRHPLKRCCQQTGLDAFIFTHKAGDRHVVPKNTEGRTEFFEWNLVFIIRFPHLFFNSLCYWK